MTKQKHIWILVRLGLWGSALAPGLNAAEIPDGSESFKQLMAPKIIELQDSEFLKSSQFKTQFPKEWEMTRDSNLGIDLDRWLPESNDDVAVLNQQLERILITKNQFDGSKLLNSMLDSPAVRPNGTFQVQIQGDPNSVAVSEEQLREFSRLPSASVGLGVPWSVSRDGQVIQLLTPTSQTKTELQSIPELKTTKEFQATLDGVLAQEKQVLEAAMGFGPDATAGEAIQKYLNTRYTLRSQFFELYETVKEGGKLESIRAVETAFERNEVAIQIGAKHYNETEDVFTPDSYRKIGNAFGSTVALSRGKRAQRNTIKGTGFLIAENLILTARHVVDELGYFDGDTIAAHFKLEDFRDFPNGWKRGGSFAVDMQPVVEAPEIDIVVLRLIPEAGEKVGHQAVVWDATEASVDHMKPICALGHPHGKELKLADLGRVYLPYSYNLNKLRRLASKLVDASCNSNRPRRIEAVKQHVEDAHIVLKRLYRDEQGKGRFCSPVANLANCLRGFGAEIDGMGGNSGGPVLSRETGLVVGLYAAGSQAPYSVISEETYEVIVPATVILQAFKNSGHSDLIQLAKTYL